MENRLESKGCEICFLLLFYGCYLKENIFFLFGRISLESWQIVHEYKFSQACYSVSSNERLKDGERGGKKVEISFGDDIKRIQNEKISKIIKELPGIENAKKKFSLEIFISF